MQRCWRVHSGQGRGIPLQPWNVWVQVYLKSISEELARNCFRQAPVMGPAGEHHRAALHILHHQKGLAASRIICKSRHTLISCLMQGYSTV